MKQVKVLLLLCVLVSVSKTVYADEVVKRKLKGNSTLTELILPSDVDTFSQMFTEGVFYGRLRLNSFLFDWEEEVEGKTKDHYTMGIGGSFIYKSAYLHGFGVTAGLYTTQNPWHMDDEDVKYYKVGRGVLSRYNVATQGEYGLTSLAQAYLEYRNEHASIRVGRQIFESRMTKSNDIMMIPNTFEGVTLHSTLFPGYGFKAAYITKQKLRDHEDFDHVFAYNDGPEEYDKWLGNDDTAMHRGITISKLAERGIDDRLVVLELDNGDKNDFSWLLNYIAVPELVSSATFEASYKWMLGDYKVSPGLRYMHQFDHGAGEMGGANLRVNTVGYDDPDSLQSALYGARIDVAKNAWALRMGMTHIADKGDIISAWRAFPTDAFGYTLLQYNWYANTTSYVLQGDYDFKAYKLHAQARYGIQDFDDAKAGVQADSNVFQLDFNKQFESVPNLYAKLRFVDVNGGSNTIALDGTRKSNPSYTDIRFELNYLF